MRKHQPPQEREMQAFPSPAHSPPHLGECIQQCLSGWKPQVRNTSVYAYQSETKNVNKKLEEWGYSSHKWNDSTKPIFLQLYRVFFFTGPPSKSSKYRQINLG